ncbi:MAG: hypothetical protein Q8L57_03565, partial [bacterium]|nr:hypothetical protein [bacterium]
LIPFFAGAAIIWIIVRSRRQPPVGSLLKYGVKILGGLILVGLIGSVMVIWPVYQFQIQNYPPERQLEDAASLLSSFGFQPAVDFNLWLISQPIFRAFGQYLLGLLMVVQRAAGGNTTYFWGEVSATGWWYYFPAVYLLKETLALHILTLAALIYCGFKTVRWLKNNRGNHFKSLTTNIHDHFPEFLMLSFIIFYWVYSMSSNLNIGVRHVLPTFPFIFILVISQIMKLIGGKKDEKSNPEKIQKAFLKAAPLAALMIWMIFSVANTYPYFIAYFNESIGGPKNGYLYVTDSNLDWGQDLKRLAMFVDNPPPSAGGGGAIEKIKLDYFGWSDPAYYLKGRAESARREDSDQKGWLAVSATFLQTSCPNDNQRCKYDERTYHWLDQHEPVAKIGYSIFVYNLK